MTPTGRKLWETLARCHGYAVVASDGILGVVETPLFPRHASEPDYLIVRAPRRSGDRRPVVSTSLVEHIDAGRRVIRLRGTVGELAYLPECLPLAARWDGGSPELSSSSA